VLAAWPFWVLDDVTPPQADRTGSGPPEPVQKTCFPPSGPPRPDSTVIPNPDADPQEKFPMPRRFPAPAEPDSALAGLDTDAARRLRVLVERIERLEEERKALGEDIKNIYREAKDAGFDPKVLKDVVRIRRQDRAAAEATQALRDLYLAALRD
jgi:uncharacterized protein (UPF0335 family)